MAGAKNISSAQCRAARALLNWSQGRLAKQAGIARTTLANFERGVGAMTRNNTASIINALEAAGVTFVQKRNDAGAGVCFRQPPNTSFAASSSD